HRKSMPGSMHILSVYLGENWQVEILKYTAKMCILPGILFYTSTTNRKCKTSPRSCPSCTGHRLEGDRRVQKCTFRKCILPGTLFLGERGGILRFDFYRNLYKV